MHWRVCQPNKCALYAILVVFDDCSWLSKMCVEAYEHAFVDLSSHSERAIQNFDVMGTSLRKTSFAATRKFGHFSSSVACFKHCKCFLVGTKG